MSKKSFFKMFAPVLVVFGLFFAAPVAALAEDAQSDRSAGQIVDDLLITSQVKAKYALEPGVSIFDIKVESYEGIVNLSGVVKSEAAKMLAEELALQVDHVKGVVNSIVVDPDVVVVVVN